jgi:hypothetical protein
VPLFPPGARPVAVSIDGRPLAAYVHAYLAGGRVFAPAAPLLTSLADRLWLEGNTLVIQRGERRIRIQLVPGFSGELNAVYVPAGPALRALGASVRYDPVAQRLNVTVPPAEVVALPTPLGPIVSSPVPREVFTPTPSATPRPQVTGAPLPRRTALPLSEPPLRPGT